MNFAGVFSLNFLPHSWMYSFKYCESTRMLTSLLGLRCYTLQKCPICLSYRGLIVFHDGWGVHLFLHSWFFFFFVFIFFFSPSIFFSAGQSNNCSILIFYDAHDLHLKKKKNLTSKVLEMNDVAKTFQNMTLLMIMKYRC